MPLEVVGVAALGLPLCPSEVRPTESAIHGTSIRCEMSCGVTTAAGAAAVGGPANDGAWGASASKNGSGRMEALTRYRRGHSTVSVRGTDARGYNQSACCMVVCAEECGGERM